MTFVYVIKMFGISLLLTLIIELIVACFMKVRMQEETVRLILLVNLLTNPAAVLIVWLSRICFSPAVGYLVQIPVEAAVIFVEARIYRYFVQKEGWNIKRPVLLAVISNLVSWLIGAVLQLL